MISLFYTMHSPIADGALVFVFTSEATIEISFFPKLSRAQIKVQKPRNNPQVNEHNLRAHYHNSRRTFYNHVERRDARNRCPQGPQLERILANNSFVEIENARLVSRFWRNTIGNVNEGSIVPRRVRYLIPDPNAETRLAYLSPPPIPGRMGPCLGRFEPPTTAGHEDFHYQGKPIARVFPRFADGGSWLSMHTRWSYIAEIALPNFHLLMSLSVDGEWTNILLTQPPAQRVTIRLGDSENNFCCKRLEVQDDDGVRVGLVVQRIRGAP